KTCIRSENKVLTDTSRPTAPLSCLNLNPTRLSITTQHDNQYHGAHRESASDTEPDNITELERVRFVMKECQVVRNNSVSHAREMVRVPDSTLESKLAFYNRIRFFRSYD